MRQFDNPTPAGDLAHWYGPDSESYGVLSDHLHLLPEGALRVMGNGRPVAVGDDGAAFKVICSEVIPISTEDGPATGRCGARVETETDYACPGHAEMRQSYTSPWSMDE